MVKQSIRPLARSISRRSVLRSSLHAAMLDINCSSLPNLHIGATVEYCIAGPSDSPHRLPHERGRGF